MRRLLLSWAMFGGLALAGNSWAQAPTPEASPRRN